MAERLQGITLCVRRPNEYTSWKPRIEHGAGFGAACWGVFSIHWQREHTRRQPATWADDVTDIGGPSDG